MADNPTTVYFGDFSYYYIRRLNRPRWMPATIFRLLPARLARRLSTSEIVGTYPASAADGD